jgi:hypothetical protein
MTSSLQARLLADASDPVDQQRSATSPVERKRVAPPKKPVDREWQQEVNAINRFAAAHSRFKTADTLLAWEQTVNGAVHSIKSAGEIIFEVRDLSTQQALLTEMRERSDFIAANRTAIATEQTRLDTEEAAKKTNWCSCFFRTPAAHAAQSAARQAVVAPTYAPPIVTMS